MAIFGPREMMESNQYFYKGATRGGHPYEYKVCPRCGWKKITLKVNIHCSNKCAQLWRGAAASYRALHTRVYTERGKASEHTCSCGKPAQEWASLTGNHADVMDYEAMCIRCHRRFYNEKRKSK